MADITSRGAYRLGRVHSVHPGVRDGKEIVRRATVAVAKKDDQTGEVGVTLIVRDLSKIAPVEGLARGDDA